MLTFTDADSSDSESSESSELSEIEKGDETMFSELELEYEREMLSGGIKESMDFPLSQEEEDKDEDEFIVEPMVKKSKMDFVLKAIMPKPKPKVMELFKESKKIGKHF